MTATRTNHGAAVPLPDVDPVDRFHAHLDVCGQCEKHPFDLCPIGARLLEKAATKILASEAR